MRKPWVIAAFAAIVLAFAVLLFALFDTKFRRFKRQSAEYHAEVAAACDFMLARYLVGGTNGVEISVMDPAPPRPSGTCILSRSNSLTTGLGSGWMIPIRTGST